MNARAGRPARAVVAAALAVLAVVAAVGSCTGDDPQPTTTGPAPEVGTGPVNGGRLVIAVPTDGGGVVPTGAPWSPSQQQIARAVYDRLAVYDDAYQVQPQLAERIEADRRFTRWTVTLRAGVVFPDGTPLDAAVVERNLDAQRASPTGSVVLAPVESVFVTGPRTVVITTRTPWSSFPHVLTGQIGHIAAPATLEDPAAATAPVGSGPFRVTAWTPGSSIELVRNSSYWRDDAPRLDEVSFRVVPGEAERVAALRSGRVDVALSSDPIALGALVDVAATGSLRLVVDRDGEAPKATFVLNAAVPPFLDPLARSAVVAATDRKALHAAAFPDVFDPVKAPTSDGSVWFDDAPLPSRDVGRARSEAARYEEIYGEPLAFGLQVPADATSLRLAAEWRRQLSAAGIGVTIEPTTLEPARARAAAGEFEATLLPLFGTWHPDSWYPALHRALMTPPGSPGANLARFGTSGIDAALDAARATDDFAEQVELYRRVQGELLAGGAYLPLVRLTPGVAAREDVRDLTVWTTATGRPGLATEQGTVDLTGVWLDRPPTPAE
jgi:peptide/nickel transport system substrate-binding protein